MASRNEAVIDTSHQSHEDMTGDDNNTAQLLTKFALPAYEPDLLSSNLGHLQLECVPEDLTEVEEEAEVDSVVDDVNNIAAVSESSTATAAAAAAAVSAAVSSDDRLQQSVTTEKCSLPSRPHTDTADMSLHVESKSVL